MPWPAIGKSAAFSSAVKWSRIARVSVSSTLLAYATVRLVWISVLRRRMLAVRVMQREN